MCLELGLGLGLSVDVVLSCSGVGLSLGTNLISQGKDLVLEHPVLGLKLGLELGIKLCLGLDVDLGIVVGGSNKSFPGPGAVGEVRIGAGHGWVAAKFRRAYVTKATLFTAVVALGGLLERIERGRACGGCVARCRPSLGALVQAGPPFGNLTGGEGSGCGRVAKESRRSGGGL